jgi:UDP-glucose 4-epimerase
MRILVTGGAGFIGSHIVDSSLAAGHEVAVLDDLSSGKRENVAQGAKLFVADLRDRDATRKVLADFKPNVVSHQAAQASVSISVKNPVLDAAVNVIGGLHLADACVEHGVERLVFASTGGAIYGEVQEGTRADEQHSKTPISPYAIHKLAYEQLLGVYQSQHSLQTTVLRYANVYGPRQDPHGEAGVVAIFFNRALAGQSVQVNARRTQGDPGCVRDYVYVSDVARANLLAIEGRLPAAVMNCGTGIPTSTEELCKLILSLSGSSSSYQHGPVRAGDLERSVLDPSLFERLLGTPVSLAEGLAQTAAWYRRAA